MILFIHGLGLTRSVWIPEIRGCLHFDGKYTDRDLLDTFTISLPGHPDEDKKFTKKDIRDKIEEVYQGKKKKQSALAAKLSLTHPKELINSLNDEKLILIGQGAGGIFCLDYTLKNPHKVRKIILIGCGNHFNGSYLNLKLLTVKTADKLGLKNFTKISSVISLFSGSKRKTEINLLLENPQKKSYLSLLNLMRTYNFEKEFKVQSLDNQLEFIKIPVLCVNGDMDLINRPRSIEKFEKVLTSDKKLINRRRNSLVMHEAEDCSNVYTRIYKVCGHYPSEKSLVDFVYDFREFLTV
jgi:pimeloyl-ACP methyl ester carboxylesterase